MSNLHALLRPFKPDSDTPFDRIKAAHLLSRAGFGGTPDEIEKVMKLGPMASVDWLMDFPDAPAEEQSRTDAPDLSSVEGDPKTCRQFVREISRDPAMLDYLNNQQNRKAHPNENYARELMELFTLGIGNYTEYDIREAARAFAGWAHDGEEFIFRRYDHDEGVKNFFGQRGNYDGDNVIEIILNHPACAKYITGKLFKYFAYEDVEQPIVDSMAEYLRENKWELRPLLRTLFTSQAFYSDKAIGVQIKSPVQLVVGTIRMLGLDVPPRRVLAAALTQMGQVPLEPPNVKGWPGGRMWINTSTLFVRYNTAVWLARGGGG